MVIKNKRIFNPKILLMGLGLLLVLFFAFLYNETLFHSLAELFNILISWSVFIFAWNTRRFLSNRYLLFIGIVFALTGGIDLVHLLSYKGMPVFQEYHENLTYQFWIIARYVQAFAFLLAPMFFKRTFNEYIIFSGFLIFCMALSVWVISGTYPFIFVANGQFTLLKFVNEAVICLVFVLSIIVLIKESKYIEKGQLNIMVISILCFLGAELILGLTKNHDHPLFILGHFLRVSGFFLIYHITIQNGLVNPYRSMFFNLQQTRDQLQKMATHDSLTKLPNRLLFEEHLAHAIKNADRIGKKVAVLFLDLDNFKEINDTYGHQVGDEFLKKISEKLTNSIRESDRVYRIGGDEFVILLENINTPCVAEDLIQRIFERNVEPLNIHGVSFKLTFSVGFSFYPDDGDTVKVLLHKADQAMYYAKEHGKNKYQQYVKGLLG